MRKEKKRKKERDERRRERIRRRTRRRRYIDFQLSYHKPDAIKQEAGRHASVVLENILVRPSCTVLPDP